jgi:two-component system, response regulator
MSAQPYVLMLESDHDDRYITEHTLSELGYNYQVKFLTFGREVISHLSSERKPFVILLDDNPYGGSGIEVLETLKSNPDYKHIPVVMVTEMGTPDHIAECYRKGANTVIRKPSTLEGTKEKIGTFFKYWFEVAEMNPA